MPPRVRAEPSRVRRLGHWIGGREVGGSHVAFERSGTHTTWLAPRAGSEELARGARVCGEATRLADRPRRRRLELLDRWLRELCAYGAWADELADALGLESEETEPELEALSRLDLARLPRASGGAGGTTVVVGHWSQLLADLVTAVAAELAVGRRVVLAGAADLTLSGHALGEAAEAAGLPPDALWVLHGLTAGTALAAWAEPAADAGLTVAGRASSPTERQRIAGTAARLGVDASALTACRAAVACVRRGDEPGEAGRRIAATFGRWPFLGGQRHGAPTRWLVDEHRFADTTAALLVELEAQRGETPVPPFEDRAPGDLLRALRHGVGEGATLIHGPDEQARDVWQPAVLTNCELHQRVVADPTPRPLVCLLRVPRGADPADWQERLAGPAGVGPEGRGH